jgi:hypothetical protein
MFIHDQWLWFYMLAMSLSLESCDSIQIPLCNVSVRIKIEPEKQIFATIYKK